MPLTWTALLFIVVNAVAYSVTDLLRKVLVKGVRPVPLLFFLSAGQLPMFVAWIAAIGAGPPGSGYWPYAAASAALNVVANLLFLEAVRVSPLSLTVPFLALTPVFTVLLAVPMLQEVPTAVQFGGVLLVVAGAFRLNLERDAAGSPAALWRAFKRQRGSVLMTAVAFLWALATPLDKLAMQAAHPAIHGLVLNAGVALGVLAILVAQGRMRELLPPRSTVVPLAVAIVASVVGLAFLLLAITVAWVGLVETLKRAIGSLLALVLGYRFFGEGLTANKLVGVVLMILGVALLVL